MREGVGNETRGRAKEGKNAGKGGAGGKASERRVITLFFHTHHSLSCLCPQKVSSHAQSPPHLCCPAARRDSNRECDDSRHYHRTQ